MRKFYVICSFTILITVLLSVSVILLYQVRGLKMRVNDLENQTDQMMADLFIHSQSISSMENRIDEDSVFANAGEKENETGKYLYRITFSDGFVIVLEEKTGKILMRTGLEEDLFTEKEKKKLREGIMLSDLESVYHYLESYSS